MQHAAHVHIQHLIPLVHFQRGQRRERHHARVINEGVDLAIFIQPGLHKRFHAVEFRYVQRRVIYLRAVKAQFLAQRRETVGAARANQQTVALGGQQARRRFADTAAGAGEQDNFAFFGHRHGAYSFTRRPGGLPVPYAESLRPQHTSQ